MAEKLSITLPAEMVSIIKARVQSGSYASTSEVLREAVRSWLRHEEEHSERMVAIRARIQQSLADPRPSVSLDDARARLKGFYAANRTTN